MRTRVGAYAWIERNFYVLLCYFEVKHPFTGQVAGGWTLPGGGMEYGEQCAETVTREVNEETGYQVEVDQLLGIHNQYINAEESFGGEDLHSVQVMYSARITGGKFQVEMSGSTTDARWFPLSEPLPEPRVPVVDVARDLAATTPPRFRWPGRPVPDRTSLS